MGTWLRRFAFEIGPLLAVAAASVLSASTFWGRPVGSAFACACGFALLTVVASGALLLERGGRVVAVLCLMVTPLGSGCAGGAGGGAGWGALAAAEGGVVAAFIAIAVVLPSAIALARTRLAPDDSSLRLARARGAWLVAGSTLALAASLLWKPPEYVAGDRSSVEPAFDVLFWTPRPAWPAELRLSVLVAGLVLAAGVIAVLVVAGLDLRDARDARARRRALPGSTPYRTAVNVALDEDASTRHRPTLRRDLLCLGVAIGATVYLAARVGHFVGSTELVARDDVGGRELAVPSLEGACRALSRGDTQDVVAARFRDTRAREGWVGQELQRWSARQPGAPTCVVRYQHTYDARRAIVDSVELEKD